MPMPRPAGSLPRLSFQPDASSATSRHSRKPFEVIVWPLTVFVSLPWKLRRRNSIGSGFGKPGTVEVPDEPVHLTVSARGYHSVEKTVADPWRAGEEWRIPLDPLPRVQGTVRQNGEPVSGAVVWFREDAPPPEPGTPSLFQRRRPAVGSWWPPPYMGGAKTGEDGRFCLSFEREASVRLMAYASAGVGESRVIVLDADPRTEGRELSAQPDPRRAVHPRATGACQHQPESRVCLRGRS